MLLLFLPFSVFALGIEDFDPVSHWTCNETSGVRYDSNVVNSNDLTDNNTVTYATGLLSNACDFEKTNSEYLSITDVQQQNLEFLTSFSTSMWIYLESQPTAGNAYRFFSKLGANDGYELMYSEDNVVRLRTRVYNGGTGNNKDFTTADLTDSTWYHVVFTYDGSSKQHCIYLNGTIYGSCQTGTINPGSNTEELRFGAFAEGSPGGFYDGLIDEITFFDYVLSSTSEITSLYNSGTPLNYASTGGGTTTATSTATSTSSVNTDDIVFMLGVIVFFLTFLWFGFIVKNFAKI